MTGANMRLADVTRKVRTDFGGAGKLSWVSFRSSDCYVLDVDADGALAQNVAVTPHTGRAG